MEHDLFLQRADEIKRQANEKNRQNTSRQTEEVTKEWSDLLTGLQKRRDTLDKLAQVWEEFEGRWQNFESLIVSVEEKLKNFDFLVRNREHVIKTKRCVEDLQSEAESLVPLKEAVWKLSGTVVTYLEACSPASAAALEGKLKDSERSYLRYVSTSIPTNPLKVICSEMFES